MNLSEALDAALPEMPKTRIGRTRPPRVDPHLVTREDAIDGVPFVAIMQRDKGSFFRFEPAQWSLAQLFDGERSYDEIAELYYQETGTGVSSEDVRLFAVNMDEADFWYKSPQEKNLAMSQRLRAQRGRRAERKSKINLAHITFSGWDPDRYLTKADRMFGRFIYNRWSLWVVLLLFLFEAFVFIAKWNVIGPDIPLYFNFTHKTFADFVEFWLLLLVLGFVHESAHGLTCKHYGGEVHSMGLLFLYLTPCFFVDVTETWVSATRVQRLATIIAGIWIEMTICGLAMVGWMNTQPGLWIHEFMYKVILITGLAVIVLNLNPLMKLDGYYFFTEMIGVPDLKERSTAFVSGWWQSRVLRLPTDVPPIPRRRAPLFIVYALLSGAYSYLMLVAVIRFAYNVGSQFIAEFAILPAGLLFFVMFRSRLRSLRALGVQVWKRHAGEGLRWRPRLFIPAAILLVLIFAPLWRDRENGCFVVEPMQPVILHASVAGRVEAVLVQEGEAVQAGQPLLRMSSSRATALRAGAEADTGSARFQTFEAELHGRSVGTAAVDEEAAARSRAFAGAALSSLDVKSPVDGVVLTADPAALQGQRMGTGQTLLVLSGGGPGLVRVYLPATALERLPAGAEVALVAPGHFSVLRMKLGPLDGAAVPLPAGVMPAQEYKGLEAPTFYSARMPLPAEAADLPAGSAGLAKIFGVRRSLFQRALTVGLDLLHEHVW